MTFLWVIRSLLLLFLLPIVIPFRALARAFPRSTISVFLLILALTLDALAIVFALILGVLGAFIDVLIVLGIVLLIWKWPRGVRATFLEKLRLAYRGAQNEACMQFRGTSCVDIAFCISVLALAVVLSLSSGLFSFVATLFIVLGIIGIIWRWPHSGQLPFAQKFRFAVRDLWRELRNKFR
jgi:hypothetical protein